MMLTVRSTIGLLALTLLPAALAACDGSTNDTWTPQPTGDTDAPVDADDDGFDSDRDCDDNDPDVNPGQAEICNEIDDNCDGFTDEGFDFDGDGHYSQRDCPFGDDCDDRDDDVNPSAEDIPYNRIDEDCKDGDLQDVDGDGVIAEVVGGEDCNDDDAAIFPGADEIPYDGIDQDCTGADLLDVDGDGHDSAEYGGDDCDDSDAFFNPSRMDWANDDIDNDCDFADGRESEFRLSRSDYVLTGATNDSDLTGQNMIICDFDGDKADDMIMTAPFSGAYQGQVSIFLSDFHETWDAEMDLEDGPDIKMLGTGSNAFFGMDVACGDIDGDGRDDLVVTKGEINFVTGRTTFDNDFMVLIYFGDDDWSWSLDERRFDVQWTADFWSEVSTTDSGVKSPSLDVGDLDGDGKAEIVLGFEKNVWPDIEADTVYIIEGRRHATWEPLEKVGKITLTMDDPVADSRRSGLSVAVVSDADGDGNNDLLVSQPFYQVETDPGDGDPVFEGRLLFMSALEADGTFEASSYGGFVGAADAQIGFGGTVVSDVDGSGQPDIVVAAPFSSDRADGAGQVYVLADPSISGSGLSLDDEASSVLFSTDGDAQLGFNIFPAADLDSDGKQDIIVRQRNFLVDSGTSNDEIFLVGGRHLVGEVDIGDAYMMSFTRESEQGSTGAGFAVGDVTADGAADFFIGAPTWPTVNFSTTYATGRAYFYPSGSYPWGYNQGVE